MRRTIRRVADLYNWVDRVSRGTDPVAADPTHAAYVDELGEEAARDIMLEDYHDVWECFARVTRDLAADLREREEVERILVRAVEQGKLCPTVLHDWRAATAR